MNRLTRWIGIAVILLAGAAQGEPDETYFALSFHVFEGLFEPQPRMAEARGALVQQAVEETSAMLDYAAARLVETKTWLVRTSGDMERLLDYRGSTIRIADDSRIQFSILFDAESRFLTLADLELSNDDGVLLRTSVGIDDGGAAVAGVIEPDGDGREYFIVLTFKVSDVPFEHQRLDAVFTVISDWVPQPH